VLLCAPAYRVAGIRIDGGEPPDLAPLREIYYPPVARVAVAFRRDRISHALDGFGVLIPSKEAMNTLGILFSSSLFPNRAPEGYALLTAYLGGSRRPDAVNSSDAGLIELALTDMRKLLGASGPPVFEDVVRIPRSIPQYNVGYAAVKDTIGRLEAQTPGVFIASSYRHGISVADCIAGGCAASEKVLQYVADG
jgi:oxygen-dependent protoporphyrinogen oxidase